MLTKSHVQMLVGLAFMGSGGFFLFGIMMLLTWPLPVPLPSLAGVEPAKVSSTRTFSRPGSASVSVGIPEGWGVDDNGWIRSGGDRVHVSTWKLAPGIALATAQERRAAAELDMRSEYDQLTAAREVTVMGRPAVELAGTRSGLSWVLVTYAFVDGVGVQVECKTDADKRYGGPLAHTRGEDWTEALPACAAVVASIKVGK